MKKKLVAILLIFTMILPMLSGCASSDVKALLVLATQLDVAYEGYVNVANNWAEENRVDLEIVACTTKSVVDQQKLLEEKIRATDYDLIVIDPLGVDELQPIIEYAQDRGSIVVSDKGSTELGADYTILPSDYNSLGYEMMNTLAECMGESGSYVTIVPSKTNQAAMKTEEACIYQQKQYFTQMVLTSRQQEAGGVTPAYNTVSALYDSYAMDGVLFYSFEDGLGIADWKKDSGNSDVAAVGIGYPDYMQEELESGRVDAVFYWNRDNLLTTCLALGYKAVKGNVDRDAEYLTTTIEGYKTLRSLGNGVFYGDDISVIKN